MQGGWRAAEYGNRLARSGELGLCTVPVMALHHKGKAFQQTGTAFQHAFPQCCASRHALQPLTMPAAHIPHNTCRASLCTTAPGSCKRRRSSGSRRWARCSAASRAALTRPATPRASKALALPPRQHRWRAMAVHIWMQMLKRTRRLSKALRRTSAHALHKGPLPYALLACTTSIKRRLY